MTQKITPFLWFDNKLEEAMELYCSIFKDAKIKNKQNGPDGKLLMAEFELMGQEFMAMAVEPRTPFNQSISFYINCEDQVEVDYYWDKFISSGGKESMCGWLEDRYGMSWQIIPKDLYKFVYSDNKTKSQSALQAMYKMRKIDVSKLEEAYNNG